MGLETANYIDELVVTNPAGGDVKGEGDDHLRLIKSALKATFPNLTGVANRVQTKTANYTVVAGDNMTVFNCTSALTLALTAAATLDAGHCFTVFANGAAVTIDPDSAELINGASTMVLSAGQGMLVFCTGTEFVGVQIVGTAGYNATGAVNEKRSTVAATATTTPLWDVGYGGVQDWTGTPTITDLPAAPQPGASRVVYPEIGTVFTNAGNIYVQGGGNYTVKSGDEVTIRAITTTSFYITVKKHSGLAVSDFLCCKNKIIGGDFTTNPWIRGTSFAAPTSGAYTADRFAYGFVGSGVVTIAKTADAPTAAQAGLFTQHCFHVDVTTADAAIAATDIYQINHRIEGLNAASFGFGQAGTRYVTLSFWHKHTKTGTYCASLRNSATDRSYVKEYTQAVSDTWEEAKLTFPVDTTGTWLYTTGIGIIVSFAIAAGSSVQTSADAWTAGNFASTANQVNGMDNVANNFKLALIQIEEGQAATPFETLPAGTVHDLCKRYAQLIPNAQGAGWVGAGGATSVWTWPLCWDTMRATPTVSGATFTYVQANTGIVSANDESSGRFQASSTTSSATVSVTITGGLLSAEL